MDNSSKISTVQNVNIYFNIANVGKRILGMLLDRLFIFAYIFVMLLILFFLILNSPEDLFNNDISFPIVMYLILVILPYFFYFLLFPIFMQGQTPGKRIVGTRIVKEDGSEAGFGTFFVRWLLNIIDIELLMAVTLVPVGLIVMLVTKKRQRIADLVAKTVVINTKVTNVSQRPDFAQLAEEYNPVFLQVLLLSDSDVRIIRESLARAKRNQNVEILQKLRQKIEDTINETKPEMTDEQYIDAVLKDYRFFAENG